MRLCAHFDLNAEVVVCHRDWSLESMGMVKAVGVVAHGLLGPSSIRFVYEMPILSAERARFGLKAEGWNC